MPAETEAVVVVSPLARARRLAASRDGACFGPLASCPDQLALNHATSRPRSELGAADQTKAIVKSLAQVVEHAGSSRAIGDEDDDLLVSLDVYANRVFGECLPTNSVARATVQLARLIGDLRIGIDGVAVVRSWSERGLSS